MVEVKSFIGLSPINDLENALGQYIIYQDVLRLTDPERVLYLAVREEVYNDLFTEEIGKLLLDNKRLKLIVFDPETLEVTKWIS